MKTLGMKIQPLYRLPILPVMFTFELTLLFFAVLFWPLFPSVTKKFTGFARKLPNIDWYFGKESEVKG